MQHIRLSALSVAMTAGFAVAAPPGIEARLEVEFPIDLVGKQALEADATLETIPGSLIVTYRKGTGGPERTVTEILAEMRDSRRFELVGGMEHMVVPDTDAAISFLEMLPWVESVEPDYVIRSTLSANDQFIGLQWGLNNTGQSIQGTSGLNDLDIDAFEAWDTTTGDSNLVIAVIDSGVQWDHPDLNGNIWSNPGEIAGNGIDDDGNGYVDDIRGWDFYNNDNNPTDPDGHGTHVAGTIGAEGNNSQGVAGVVWQCKIMPLRFIGPNGGSTSDAIAAINYAVAEGCKLSNNSWGGGGFSTALRNAISNADANGHLFVAAAGNDGRNTDSQPAYPASYNNPNIISVANINNQGGLEFDSNYGATTVDIGAPGDSIASTYTGSSYVWLRGTSMASPHVTGVAALIWSEFPSLTHDEVRDAILNSATPLGSLTGISTTGGFLNANDALAAAAGGGSPPPPPPPAGGPPNAPSGLNASNNGGGVALLTWNDNSNNESGFEVEWQQQIWFWWGSGGSGTVGADATAATVSLGSGTYRFRIRAFNSDGNSSWTGWDTVTLN
ncbi:MAG: S8 family serine peptidase [Planctomycetota bacterium]